MNAIKTIIAASFVLIAGFAHALPPSVEFDKLSLEAKNALQAKDFAKAETALNKLRGFEFKLPDSYWYLLGTAQMGLEKYKSASKSFENYLNLFGNQGKFYKEALEALTASEKAYEDNSRRQAAEQSKYEEQLDKCVSNRLDNCGSYCGNRPNSGKSKSEIGECMLERCGYAPKWTEVWGNNDWEEGKKRVIVNCQVSLPKPILKSFE